MTNPVTVSPSLLNTSFPVFTPPQKGGVYKLDDEARERTALLF
ncbi:MAG: hypothetical protein WAT68_00645 [Candidatus Nitrotoga sp.]